jgi:hypothetical protein
MASASCAGPLPPYPHSKPVGLWLRSSQQGSRSLGSLVPSVTQTTHPSGPRHPDDLQYRWSARSWCSLSWIWKPCPQAASRRRGKGAAPPGYSRDGLLPLSPGARRERSRDGPLRRRKRKRQRHAFTGRASARFPTLVSLRIRNYRLGIIASDGSCERSEHGHLLFPVEWSDRLYYPPGPVSGACRS